MERKTELTILIKGLGITMMKSLKTLSMTRLRRRGCCWPGLSLGERGGDS